jgi:Zn-dependent protease with chaperone function
MGIVGVFIVLQALLLLVDPRSHDGIYAIYLLIGVSLQALLVQALLYGVVAYLLARQFKRLRERAA